MSYSKYAGPLWHRYNDGAWPLLAKKRAHYKLAAGHRQQAEKHRGARGFTKARRPPGGLPPPSRPSAARDLSFSRLACHRRDPWLRILELVAGLHVGIEEVG